MDILMPFISIYDFNFNWIKNVIFKSFPLFLATAFFSIFSAGLIIAQNFWQQHLIDSLVQRNAALFWSLIHLFGLMLAAIAAVAYIRIRLEGQLAIALRLRLCSSLISKYRKFQYQLESSQSSQSYAEQRLVDDIEEFASELSRLFNGSISVIVRMIGAGYVLYIVGGSLTINHIFIPGCMVLFASLTAIVTLSITHFFGHALGPLESKKVNARASLRHQIMRWREHAISIAILNGNRRESVNAFEKLHILSHASFLVVKVRSKISGLNQLLGPTDILAWIVLAPVYLSGGYTIGAIFQISNAHSIFVGAVSWIAEEYGHFTRLRSAYLRINSFYSLLKTNEKIENYKKTINHHDTRWNLVGTISVPYSDGSMRLLAIPPVIRFDPGCHTLINAPSGSGKSVLFQVLAGLWPYWNGTLNCPPKKEVQFIPQRSYLPIDSLAAVLAFPDIPLHLNQHLAIKLLDELQLGYLIPRLNHISNWFQELSGGEAQRIALIRAILKHPTWLFLDEATNAMDQDLENYVMKKILSCTEFTVICISHNDRLKSSFDHVHIWREAPRSTLDEELCTVPEKI